MAPDRSPSAPPGGALAAWVRLVPALLVGLAMLFNVAAYRDELTSDAPDLNDHVFHLGLISRIDAAWEDGANPHDPWIPYWGEGFPVVRYYQHLPHEALALAHRLLRGAIPLATLFAAARFALLVLVPLAFYRGARQLGMTPLAASLVACCTPFLGADPSQRYFLGFQLAGFTWYGGGLFPQLVGLVLFPLALGATSRAVLEGRRYAPALLALVALTLSHLLLGLMGLILGLLLPLRPEAGGRRLQVAWRLAALYGATLMAASHLILPPVLESGLLNRSVWEGPAYWDSFGAARVLGELWRGGLLDGDRLPVLTALAALGLVAVLAGRLRRASAGAGPFAVMAFALALLLFFGRPTWGRLLDLLPMGHDLPWHRFLCAVQLGGLLLAGLGLTALWQGLGWDHSARRLLLAALGTAVLLGPAVAATAQRVAWGRAAQRAAAEQFHRQGPALEQALQSLRDLERDQPGRGYAGASWDWGRGFQIAGAPAWAHWTAADLPAISYMFHTMGLSSDLEAEFDPGRLDDYALFNVRYLLAPDPERLPPFAQPVGDWPGLVAAQVQTPGYFDVVRADWAFSLDGSTPAQRLAVQRAFVRGPWHEQGEFVRLALAGDPPTSEGGERRLADPDLLTRPPPQERPRPGRVLRSWREGEAYGAEVEAAEPAVVLFRMTYHPGWQVSVDGVPAPTFMLTPAYLGVRVGPGRHRIAAVYRPAAWTAVLTLVGGLVLLGAWLGDRLRLWRPARGEPRVGLRRALIEAGLMGAVLALALLVAGLPLGAVG